MPKVVIYISGGDKRNMLKAINTGARFPEEIRHKVFISECESCTRGTAEVVRIRSHSPQLELNVCAECLADLEASKTIFGEWVEVI